MASDFKQLFRQQLRELGKAGLNAIFPNDFEYYVVSLELLDSRGRIVEFLVFPVPPKSISQTEINLSTVKVNFSGVTTINYPGFVPKDVNIQGDFGRNLKIMLGSELVHKAKMGASTAGGNFSPFAEDKILSMPFSNKAKTGYGAIKVLQSIHRKSNTLDSDNKPYKLFFYNPALGDSYLVKSQNLIVDQSNENNMIWQYNLSMKAIAPARAIRSDVARGLRDVLTVDFVQGATNALVRTAKTFI